MGEQLRTRVLPTRDPMGLSVLHSGLSCLWSLTWMEAQGAWNIDIDWWEGGCPHRLRVVTKMGRGSEGCPHPVTKGLGVVTPGSSLC